MRVVVVDLEGTSSDPYASMIVEWAAVYKNGWDSTWEHADGLVKPPILIPPETSAIHHIVDRDVEDSPSWSEASRFLDQMLAGKDVVAVAHNADYERAMLGEMAERVPWICTFKAACRIWPHAPGFSNECLRYMLSRDDSIGRGGHQMTHSALHDARVTAHLFDQLLIDGAEAGVDLDDMIRWSDEPALLPKCPIGKYRGTPWDEIDDGYLEWILFKATDMREDVKFCAQRELDRRHNAPYEEGEDEPAYEVEDHDGKQDDIPF